MTVILADIGGTHARFACLEKGGIAEPQKYAASAFPALADALMAYCAAHGKKPKGKIRIAAAARNHGDTWRFLNGNPWIIDPKALAKAGWKLELIVNDFAASARGALALTDDQLITLKQGVGATGAARAILGPGTGLGLAYLIPAKKGWHVQETFGGHMLATARTEEQFRILRTVGNLRGNDAVVFEDVVSGRGLPLLYRAVCAEKSLPSKHDTAESLIADAQDTAVRETLRLFYEFLGLFAHNAAVSGHAIGGLYLDGGMIQRLHTANLYDAASFERFFVPDVAPTVKAALAATPVWLIRDPFVALRGLAAMA